MSSAKDLPQTVAVREESFRYTGPVYVRPLGRGLVLGPDSEGEYLDDVLAELFTHGDYDMEITVQALPVEESE